MTPETRLVCAYVMTSDSGHAPNPFHGTCTLAICTPNHQRSRSKPGDWILGLAGSPLRSKLGTPHIWRLLYAMHVDTRLELDSYYTADRFASKRPKLSGSLEEQCGDNFYRLDREGKLFHTGETTQHQAAPPGEGIEKQDMDANRVFVGERFWYWGRNAQALPRGVQWAEKLISAFISSARGIRNVYDDGKDVEMRWSASDLAAFTVWLPPVGGVLGLPIEWRQNNQEASLAARCSPTSPRNCTDTQDVRGATVLAAKNRKMC
ncbi:hypothetical protein [Cupriavidus plantarum]